MCYPEKLQLGLKIEANNWKKAYARHCNDKYRKKMDEILGFIADIKKRLSRELRDLDDIRLLMKALHELREREIEIEMQISPIEVSKGQETGIGIYKNIFVVEKVLGNPLATELLEQLYILDDLLCLKTSFCGSDD